MASLLQRIAGTALLLFLCFPGLSVIRAAEPETPPLHALIVGGGPDRDSNAAQIEGHARFVAQLLPPSAKHFVLFADGKPDNASVTYIDLSAVAEVRRAMAVLLPKNGLDAPALARVPNLGIRTDGPSRRDAVHRGIAALLPRPGEKPAPLLLYFAGHGSTNGAKEEDTQYDLWNGDALKVRDLASEIARLPPNTPVVLVMAQCYSGAFADVLFRDGNPKGDCAPQNVAGFFASKKDREASGCGWETSAESYQDFSSYFFGAICGHDRFGKPLQSADFDGDGKVSLHEAFCYALAQDASFDTPVCTSDAFLKRFASLPDSKIYEMPYEAVWKSATPAQRAALEALSEKLGLDGEQRALTAYDRLHFSDPVSRPAQLKSYRDATDHLNELRQTTLDMLFQKWPALRWNRAKGYSEAVESAALEMGRNKALCRDLIEAEKAQERTDAAVDNEEAWLMRFVGLYESVVRAKHLRETGKDAVKSRFEQLWEAEQRSLPVGRG